MKKKIFYSFILIGIMITLSGCLGNNEKSGITVTVYPIEYIINRLYNYDCNIKSIYPNDTKVDGYSLTAKQIKNFAKETSIFAYNGVTNEKEIAKTLIDKNKRIQIIDVTYGLKYKYSVEELWLSPNNYLMLANTVKNDLVTLSSNKYAANDIEENFLLLQEDIATLDAELRSIGKNAQKNKKNTIVVSYSALNFLSEYGFNVIDISDEKNITTELKNSFKDKKLQYIFVGDKQDVPNSTKDIVDNYEAKLITVESLSTLTEAERLNNDDYITIMNAFISKLSDLLLN